MTTDPNLVLDPANANYILPAPPRGAGMLTVEQEAATPRYSQSAGVARAIGERFQVTAQSLEILLSELRDRVQQLDLAIAEDTRAQLKGAVREISNVLDWCDSAGAEMATDSAKAATGLEPIDVVDMCNQLSAGQPEEAAPIAVVARNDVTCWANRAELSHVLHQALALVFARTGGQGLRCLEAGWRDHAPSIRVYGRGEPVDDIDPELVEGFRRAVAGTGITVVPDDLGPGGAGMVLRLPV